MHADFRRIQRRESAFIGGFIYDSLLAFSGESDNGIIILTYMAVNRVLY